MQSWRGPAWPEFSPSPGQVWAYDTASGARQPVGPASGAARLYVCGITPYDATHLGHANTYLAFDLLQRAWRDCGLSVHYVQNVTDVDDPLLERARATGVDWRELAQQQTELFRADMTALQILPPQHFVGVVEAMPLVVDSINSLQATGSAYSLADPTYPDMYFRTADDPQFLQLSKLDRDDALAMFAERGGDPHREGKAEPFDSLVWRTERAGEPSWESPFGAGRPGWHIECVAIARHYLGVGFDVQGGGSDLIFPHHEMSAGLARSVGGELAEAYIHAGMVGLDGQKMSKSLGNLVLVSELRSKGVDPMAIRLALLSHHYRTDWFYTDELLSNAELRLARWREAVQRPTGPPAGAVIAQVRTALRDDLDAPLALAAIDAWVDQSMTEGGADAQAPGLIAALSDAVLGVALR